MLNKKYLFLLLLILLSFITISNINAADVYINDGDDWKNKLDTATPETKIIFNNTKIKNFSYTTNKNLQISGINSSLIGSNDSQSIWRFNPGSDGSSISNLTLTNSSFVGIYLNNVSNISIKNCIIDNSTNNGIDIVQGSKNIIIDNITILNAGGGLYNVGIWTDKAENVSINRAYIINSVQDGIQLLNSKKIIISNSIILNSYRNGVHLNNVSDIELNNVSISETISNSGVWIDNNCKNIIIDRCNISDNIGSINNYGINAKTIENFIINNTIISNNSGNGIFSNTITNFILTNTIILNNSGFGTLLQTITNITLNNITVSYSGGQAGIRMLGINNLLINESIISNNFQYGIFSASIRNFTISNNNITNNSKATNPPGTNIWLAGGINGTIFNNNITYGYNGISNIFSGSGIALDKTSNGNSNISIYKNNISNNGRHGITAGDNNKEIYIYDNIFDGNKGVCIKTSSGTTKFYIYNNFISNSASTGIELLGTYCEAYDNNIWNVSVGISTNGNNNSIINNNITNGRGNGISMGGKDNFIKNNIISNNTNGIYISGSNNTVTLNNINKNRQNGISISTLGKNNTIYKNEVINNNNNGIVISGTYNIINNNIISKNNYSGIDINSGKHNLLENNQINDNLRNGLNFGTISENNTFSNGSIYSNKANGTSILGTNNKVINSTISNNHENGIVIGGNQNYVNNSDISNNHEKGILITGNNNSIIQSNIFNNDNNGIKINGNNNLIISSNIVNNQVLGLNVSGNGNIVNYNRIFNNTIKGLYNFGDNNNFTLNWWGKNNISNEYEIISGIDCDISNWFVLELSSINSTETFTTIVNTTKIYSQPNNIDLNYVLSVYNNVPHNSDLLPLFNVTVIVKENDNIIYSTSGDIRNISVSVPVYIFDDTTKFSINALSDGEDVILNIFGTDNRMINLAINKSLNVSTVYNGEFIEYIITIANNGPDNATNVNLTELFSEKLIFISAYISKGLYNNSNHIWYIGNISVGETVSLTIKFLVNGTGNINNLVVVKNKEKNIGDNNSSTNVISEVSADLSIIKTVTNSIVNINSYVNYRIIVRNNGPNNASDVQVIDKLPNGLSYISHNGAGEYDPNTGIWNIGNLSKNSMIILNILAKTNSVGIFTNFATVTSNEYDINIANNHATTTVEVVNIITDSTADLAISKTVNKNKVNIGDKVIYAIIVKNNGPNNASGIQTIDKLHKGLVYITHSVSKGIYDPISGLWIIGNLTNDEIAILKIVALVTKNQIIKNEVRIAGDEFDPILSNNYDVVYIDVENSLKGDNVEHNSENSGENSYLENNNDNNINNDIKIPLKKTGSPILVLIVISLISTLIGIKLNTKK